MSAAFDSVTYKETTRVQWQDAAEAWRRYDPVFDRWLGEATEAMLDLAGVGPGSRVLDIAAGSGGQTIVRGAAGRSGRRRARDRHLLEHPPRGRGHGPRRGPRERGHARDGR